MADATTNEQPPKRMRNNMVSTETAASKVSGKSKPKVATKQVLQDKNNELEDQISRLKAQLQQVAHERDESETARREAEGARKGAEAARKEAERIAKVSGMNKPTHIIQKPKAGEFSDGSDRLRRAMELGDDKPMYLAIQSLVRDLVHQVRLDLQAEYRHQPSKELGDLFRMARHRNPYLAKFHNDWATAELVKQYLSNRRKCESRKRKRALTDNGSSKRARHIDDFDGNGEGEENGGEDGDDHEVG